MSQGVHQHATGNNLLCHASRAVHIAAQHHRAQAVLGIVGNGDRLRLVLIRDDAQHRAENLVAGNGHPIVHAGKQRRTHKPAVPRAFRSPFAARQQARPFFDSFADIALHPQPLLFADHRADVCRAVARVAGFHCRHGLRQRGFDLRLARVRHQNARPGHARLPAVHKPGLDHQRDRPREIHIIQQDRRRFTAQLQRDALKALCRVAQDRLAGIRGTGERDFRDVRMAAEGLAHRLAASGDDVKHARRQRGVAQRFGDNLRLQSAHFARLDDRRAARRQRGRQFAADKPRIAVPRRNQPGHAERRHLHRCGTCWGDKLKRLKRLDGLSNHLCRIACHPRRARGGRAVLLNNRVQQRIMTGGNGGVHALQRGDAFLLCGLRPCRKRRFCGRDSAFSVNLIRQANLTHNLRRRRVVQIKPLGAVRGNKFAVNKDLFDGVHINLLRLCETSLSWLLRCDNPRYAARVVSIFRIIYASFRSDRAGSGDGGGAARQLSRCGAGAGDVRHGGQQRHRRAGEPP